MFSQKRKFFSKAIINPNASLPDLTKNQKLSYDWFLNQGIKELIKEFSPIKDLVGKNFELHFLDCSLGSPRFNQIISKNRNLTYEAPLTVKVRLVNKKTGEKTEQDVYFGDIPLMTDKGTLIINGIERVIIQQLIRSPGIIFSRARLKGRFYYSAKIIPDRGAWIEFETDTKGIIWARIDRQRKIPATALLRVFGFGSDTEILDLFKRDKEIINSKYIQNTLDKDPSASEEEGLIEVYRKVRPGDLATADNARSLIHAMFFNYNRYDLSKVGRYKLNQRLHLDAKITERTIRPEDIRAVIGELIRLNVRQK